MLRAGFIKRLSAGIYTYLPLGMRSLERVIRILREEMSAAGAAELLMPALHPSDLWRSTGRYEALGEDKFAFKNRSGLEYVLAPTHEELITQIVAETVKSYKDLPLVLYQIQGKFRDEARPRFGVIRSKEFLMKDAYSFDRDEKGLDENYRRMHEAYVRLFQRTGLDVVPVSADPGLMGGKVSHEFMVRTPYGEDRIAECVKCGYLASLEVAEGISPVKAVDEQLKDIEKIRTPGITTIERLSESLKIDPKRFLKAIIYVSDGEPVMVCLRGDHEVNEAKLKRLLGAVHLELASAELIEKVTAAPVGFSGPVKVRGVRIVLDRSAEKGKSWVTGANEKDLHLKNVASGRDFKADVIDDIRYATAGDLCPKCSETFKVENAMEMGHIFKLGVRYSKALKAQYLDEKGEKNDIIMGCYGIGVNRILAAAIEQFNDEKGILWPKSIAPFDVQIITLGEVSGEIKKETDKLEKALKAAGLEVLVDDREERAGVKFNDADLIGIPVQAVVSGRNLKDKKIEVKVRKTGDAVKVPIDKGPEEIRKIYGAL
jgi:prolyl-tRNA synthetase